MGQNSPRVALVQDGARGHYGLALALQNAQVLQVMYTDFYVRRQSPLRLLSPLIRRLGSAGLRRILDRQCAELDDCRVRTNLRMRFRQERRRSGFSDSAAYFQWQAADTANWIARHLRPPSNIVMGSVRNIHPRLCQIARDHGMKCVADQIIAPAAIEFRETCLQHSRFPDWENIDPRELESFAAFESETWRVLDCVTCPSEYVAEGLRACGVPAANIEIIPYPIDETHFTFVDRRHRTGPLTVGFVGQVGLRKGVPYFYQVAKRFAGRKIRFVLVGNSTLNDSAMEELRRYCEVQVARRSEVPGYLASFDLIYFPTTCEGSACALMEAMASGLPIVTSPNSGTHIRHEREGFICAYDDVDAAAAYIERLAGDEELRCAMGRAAAARYKEFDLGRYSAAIGRLMWRILADASQSES